MRSTSRWFLLGISMEAWLFFFSAPGDTWERMPRWIMVDLDIQVAVVGASVVHLVVLWRSRAEAFGDGCKPDLPGVVVERAPSLGECALFPVARCSPSSSFPSERRWMSAGRAAQTVEIDKTGTRLGAQRPCEFSVWRMLLEVRLVLLHDFHTVEWNCRRVEHPVARFLSVDFSRSLDETSRKQAFAHPENVLNAMKTLLSTLATDFFAFFTEQFKKKAEALDTKKEGLSSTERCQPHAKQGAREAPRASARLASGGMRLSLQRSTVSPSSRHS